MDWVCWEREMTDLHDAWDKVNISLMSHNYHGPLFYHFELMKQEKKINTIPDFSNDSATKALVWFRH